MQWCRTSATPLTFKPIHAAAREHDGESCLQSLRKKAEEKNPDEFYFGMENVTTKGGVHTKE